MPTANRTGPLLSTRSTWPAIMVSSRRTAGNFSTSPTPSTWVIRSMRMASWREQPQDGRFLELQLQSGANLTYSGGYNGSTNYNMNLNGAIIPGSKSVANPNGITIN